MRILQESHHEKWYRPRDNVCVECRSAGFLGIQASDEQLWEELARETEPLSLGGYEDAVRVPGVAARTLLVGLHAAANGPAGTPLEDLVRAVNQVPAETWRGSRRARSSPPRGVSAGHRPLIRSRGRRPLVGSS